MGGGGGRDEQAQTGFGRKRTLPVNGLDALEAAKTETGGYVLKEKRSINAQHGLTPIHPGT